MSLGWRSFRRVSFGGLLLLVAVAMWILVPHSAVAQSSPNVDSSTADVQDDDEGVSAENLITAQGSEIGHGQNSQPVGPLGIKTFRVEQVSLSEPREVSVAGQSAIVTTALRLTVSGGPFVVRDMPYVIWVGDKALGAGQESVDLSSISVVTFDPTLLRNGSTISVSAGFDATRRTDLPDKLSINVAP
jgi:hypothetical protein